MHKEQTEEMVETRVPMLNQAVVVALQLRVHQEVILQVEMDLAELEQQQVFQEALYLFQAVAEVEPVIHQVQVLEDQEELVAVELVLVMEQELE
jgi:hypothetical protein